LENLKTKRGGRSLAEQPQSCPREDLKSTSLSTCIVWAQQRDTQLYNTQFDFFFFCPCPPLVQQERNKVK
jgi:hypothetical protein